MNWNAIASPEIAGVVFQSFAEINSKLIAFGVLEPATATSAKRIYRTADGTNWERIDGGTLPDGLWSHSIVYKNLVYAADQRARLWRQNNGLWELLPWQNNDETGPVSFAIFQDTLFAAFTYEIFSGGNIPTPFLQIAKTNDGISWQRPVSRFGTFSVTSENFGLFEINKKLVLLNDGAFVIDPTLVNYPEGIGTYRGWHFAVFETIYTVLSNIYPGPFAPNSIIRYENNEGVLSTTGPALINKNEPTPFFNHIAYKDHAAYVLLADLWIFKHGIVDQTSLSMVPKNLARGQKDRVVLSWNCRINHRDALKSLRVTNHGTARQNNDLENVRLFQATDNKGQNPLGFELAKLIPADDGQSWTLPADTSISFEHDVDLFVAVDIARNARDGRTCQFSLGQTGWNEEQRTDSVETSNAQSINGVAEAAPLSIEDVVVYPQPAKDSVYFGYDLASQADVRVEIFDRTSQRVAVIEDWAKSAQSGASSVWNTKEQASGVYYALIHITDNTGQRNFRRKVFVEK